MPSVVGYQQMSTLINYLVTRTIPANKLLRFSSFPTNFKPDSCPEGMLGSIELSRELVIPELQVENGF
jgi:hypothetical protein